jgi:hypothetical protein
MNKTGGGNPMMDHNDEGDKTKDMTYILTKFLARGYEALSDEELAVTLINPDFNGAFKKKTGRQVSRRRRLDLQVPNTDHRQTAQRQL